MTTAFAWPPPAPVEAPPRTPTEGWLLLAGALLAALEQPRLAAGPATPATVAPAAVDAEALLVALYEREAANLVRLARLFTDDRNAAEDLVQEAFVRLHRAVHRIEQPERAAAYLRSIVLNLARDHNRRGLMSLRHFEALTPESSAEAPEDRIELDEQKARVLQALRALSPQQRSCLVLRFYLELSEREVADTLGISVNSVKTHTRRGMERLRLLLQDTGELRR
jgi:RNA polymerase sigma-70 factor (sigma-E family)